MEKKNKALSKERKVKKHFQFGVNVLSLLICILNALNKIIAKLLTTHANGIGHQSGFFVFLLANAWHLSVSALAPAASWRTE